MKDAESKTKSRRVRHCYPRAEVYHRWIHDPEYVYASHGGAICGREDYLFINSYRTLTNIEELKDRWAYFRPCVIAIIDRYYKKICISKLCSKYSQELVNSLPDDYEIFWCKGSIPIPDILAFNANSRERLFKEHLTYMAEQYTQWTLRDFYNALGRTTLHVDIDCIAKKSKYSRPELPCYNSIKQFVTRHKIKSYAWYKQSLTPNYRLQTYYPTYYSAITITVPSIQKIITNTVFTKAQKEYFRKKYFYTKYCYGRGIPFKDVEQYWNKEISSDELRDYFDKHNCYWDPDYYDNSCTTWNNCIIRFNAIEKNRHEKYIKENIDKSNQNRKEAIDRANSLINQKDRITAWRNGETVQFKRIPYEQYLLPRGKAKYGTWTIDYICVSTILDNTQLKLQGEHVVTSRHASVLLSDAVKVFQLFIRCYKRFDSTGQTKFVFPERIKVGIYNLRDIQFLEKVTDSNKPLRYNSWRIRIGCHNLWVDDFIEFVQYYHLEELFPINEIIY